MKPSVVELFANAADRAKDVAVMMEAARALTVLGRSLMSREGDGQRSGEPAQPDAIQVFGLYQTAERLGQHVRQMSSEARTLLVTAKQMLQSQPRHDGQVPIDFDDVCHLMDEAMERAVEAVERLDAMRLASTPVLAEPADPIEAPPQVQLMASDLFLRLRQRGE